nr:hypothetical protein [uncultured bacterium]
MFRSQMKYHPRIGFTYMPGAKTRVPGPNGGYLVRTNSIGFRSDREFEVERQPGVFRTLLFGDSQTAGDGTSNASRYSDLIEGAVPGLEVFNYGLSGTGPAQQLLAFEDFADVDHDLVVIGFYVENIRRATRGIVKSLDADGNEAYYAKPFFRLDGDDLALENVPVPKKGWTSETLPEEYRSQIYNYSETNFFSRDDRDKTPLYESLAKARPLAPVRKIVKNLAVRLSEYDPLPEYSSADDPSWVLLRRILERWIAASDAPVLLFTIPHHLHLVAPNEPTGYQARFAELAASSGCHLYDPLPDLGRLTSADRRTLWSDEAGHLSRRGHEVFAELLAPVIAGFAGISSE